MRDDDALINAVRRARGTVLATSAVGTHAYTNVFGETAPALLRAFGAYTGNAYVNPDSAAVLRTVVHSQNGLPSFGVILAERQLGHEISTKGYPAVVDYAGPPGTFDNVSFADVCSGLKGCTGNVKPSFFRGKTVLIGATAAVLQDLHASPVGANMSGVEYWANALWSILRGNPLRGAAGAINVLAIVLMTLVVPLLVLWLRPGLVLVGFAIAIGAVYLVIAQLEFDSNTLLPIVYPLIGLTLGTVEATAADLGPSAYAGAIWRPTRSPTRPSRARRAPHSSSHIAASRAAGRRASFATSSRDASARTRSSRTATRSKPASRGPSNCARRSARRAWCSS